MSWNYRVVRHDDGQLAIHEAYYDQYGAVDAITTRPVPLWGDDIRDLRVVIARFITATMKPVLEYSDIGQKERWGKA